MAGFGFSFRYRLSGYPPSIRCFAHGGERLVPEDMVNLDAGVPTLATSGDVSLLGCLTEPSVPPIVLLFDPSVTRTPSTGCPIRMQGPPERAST